MRPERLYVYSSPCFIQDLESKIITCTDEGCIGKYNAIKITAETLIESVKQAIVMMQLAKVSKLAGD